MLLLAALAVVIGIRIHLLRSTDFPINDGALFLSFIDAIVPVFPALPGTILFSGLHIPFAYPPLSFWLAAGAVRLGANPLALVHFAPIVMNIGYLLLFTCLLRRTGHSRLFAAVAVLVFGTSFLSYEWLVMGGGLSRGLGSLFLLMTLLVQMPAVARPSAQPPSMKQAILGGLCIGAALLSHLEWGMLAAFSSVASLALAPGSLRTRLRAMVMSGAVAAVLVAPWLAFVVQAHGPDPFIAAARTGSLQDVGGAPGGAMKVALSLNLLLPFVVVGAVAVLRSRDAFWLLFAVAAMVLTPRGGRTPLMLALGVLAASGLLTSLVLVRQWAAHRGRVLTLRGLGLAVVALLAIRTVPAMQADPRFVVLPREVRDAMAWVAARHPGDRFAVLNDTAWYYNASAEWFPVLARAVNTTTVQGREWLPDHDFRRAERAVRALNASTDCEQLLRNLRAFAASDFIWAEGVDLRARSGAGTPKSSASSANALRGPGTLAGCFDGAGYEEVHANDRVRIFRAPPGGSAPGQ